MGKTFARCRTQRFASKVTHNPAISCSDDAQVAVCTDEGVYILIIRCDQIYPSNNIVLHTSKIAPSSKVKTFDVDVPRQKLERTLPKMDNHQLMLDRTVSPLMQSNQVMTGFRAVAWSPGGADALGRCIITSLSCDHRLCIHELQRDGQAWIKVVELSELFYEHVKEESFHLAKERIDQVTGEHCGLMEKLKWQTYCLAAVAMSWSPVFTESPGQETIDRKKESTADECSRFAILAVAMKSGHIVLWKVKFPVTSESCHIEHVMDTGSDVPTALCWARLDSDAAVLAVAALEGQLRLYLISAKQTTDQGKEQTMDQGKEQTMDPGMEETVDQVTPVVKKRSRRKSKPCEDSKVRDHEETLAKDSEDPDDEEQNGTSGPDHEETSSWFSVTEMGPLWSECDNVPIRNLCWASQDNLLFASKGPFLLTFHVAINTGTNHASVKCPEVKVKAHPPKLIGDKLGISALWWDQTKLFVSLTNGQVCCVNVGQDSSLTVDVVDIQRESTDNMKHVDVPSWQVHGVCGTPGGVYLCLLESPAGDYCHLTILEPLKLTLVLRADTDVASVVLKQDESLCGCIDALAQVKFILAQKQPLPESLAQLVKDKSAWPNLPIGRQKLLRFLLQAMKLANVESEVTSEDVLEADKLIMKSHLETALTRLLKMEIKPATDAEKKSLMLVCDWLSSCHGNSKSHDQHLTQKVIGMLEHVQPDMDTREKCEICEANISFTSYRKDQCPNGHVFARCCQSLLLCHSVPYRTCVSCEALAIGQHISGSSWFEDLKTNTCTFCDGLLL